MYCAAAPFQIAKLLFHRNMFLAMGLAIKNVKIRYPWCILMCNHYNIQAKYCQAAPKISRMKCRGDHTKIKAVTKFMNHILNWERILAIQSAWGNSAVTLTSFENLQAFIFKAPTKFLQVFDLENKANTKKTHNILFL